MYDLIVIGDDFSSPVAAAVASRRNIKTVLISEIGLGEICTIGGLDLILIPHL